MRTPTLFGGIRRTFLLGENAIYSPTRWPTIAGLVLSALMASAVNAEEAKRADAFASLSYEAGPESWTGDLSPISRGDWSYERAAHLLERAGFGGTPEEIARLAAMTPQGAVNFLVDYEYQPEGNLPAFDESGIWSEEMLPHVDENFDFRTGIAKARRTGQAYGVKPNDSGWRPYQPVINMLYYRNYATRLEWNRATIWWAGRMLNTNRPLEEKMTLFWHGHFAVEQEKIRDYRLMLDQLDMLRQNAVGNFRDLLLGVAQDPAMLVYLDNRKNIEGRANENFAREVMELFALGVGNYTEDDIKEAARALTGWTNFGREFRIEPELHDSGQKTILGKTGNFDGGDVIEILLDQEVCAEFISRKVHRFFVREELADSLNEELAVILREGDYEMKPLLKALFLSKDFYSPAAYANQIKGPVQYLVSTYRKLGLTRIPGIPNFAYVARALGQALGNPPNVKGWDGGKSWINPSTLMERGNVIRHFLYPAEAAGSYDLGPFAGRYQRYVNAHMEVLDRDREALLGTATAMGGGEDMMMDGGAMSAPSANMINETVEYDLPYGVYNGMTRAYATVRPPDQSPAQLDVAGMLRRAGGKTSRDAVLYFERRLLRMPIADSVRDSMVRFVSKNLGGQTIPLRRDSARVEETLRGLLHLLMSTPEYQLG